MRNRVVPLEPDMDTNGIGCNGKKTDLAVSCNTCKHGNTGATVVIATHLELEVDPNPELELEVV